MQIDKDARAHTHAHQHIHSLSHSLSHRQTHTYAHKLTVSLSLSKTHTHTHTDSSGQGIREDFSATLLEAEQKNKSNYYYSLIIIEAHETGSTSTSNNLRLTYII